MVRCSVMAAAFFLHPEGKESCAIRRPATTMDDRPSWPRPPVDTDAPRGIHLPLILVPRPAGDRAASVTSDDDEP